MLIFSVTGNVRNYFFNRNLIKSTKDLTRTLELVPFSSIKYVGLIVGRPLIEKDLDSIKQIVKLLDDNEKNYFFIVLGEQKHLPDFFTNIPHLLVSKKDLTFSRVPSDKILKALKSKKFDFLIDLNYNPNQAAFFIEAIISATLRIGKADPKRYPFVDLMIEWRETDDASQFMEYIIYYLQMLTGELK